MDFTSLLSELEKSVDASDLRLMEPLWRHTSIKIGGPVEALITPRSKAQLMNVCSKIREYGITPLLIGNGSNILASDSKISKIAIKTYDGLSEVEFSGDTCIAGSGILLSKLAVLAQKNGMTGLEFAYGIPGTLGGAVYMNAGAYGSEIKDVVFETEALYQDGQIKTVSEHDFAYRHSIFFNSDEIILNSTLRLSSGDPEEIMRKMSELSAKRKASQPLDVPSAGSTFKRPKAGFAAALIDEAGLKGFSIGGAEISTKHAGFIINKGAATCEDVLRLIEHVEKTVMRIFGIELEPEVRFIK